MTDPAGMQVLYYQMADGRRPMEEWLDALSEDKLAFAAIQTRIDRIERGLTGDWKTVGGGVSELRIDHGPGYRVYFGRDGLKVIVLLCGGIKSTQSRDIKTAKKYWSDYEKRKPPGGSAA